jgi:hypothetical protein
MIAFPTTPNLYEIFHAGGRSWQWDGSVWKALETPKQLADIAQSGATPSQIPMWNGTEWTPQSLGYMLGTLSGAVGMGGDELNLAALNAGKVRAGDLVLQGSGLGWGDRVIFNTEEGVLHDHFGAEVARWTRNFAAETPRMVVTGLATENLASSTSGYIIVQTGDNLAAKYTAAKALTPNGAAKSATNRASLIIFPGTYSLSAELAIDAEFVDVIGLGAQTQNPAVFVGGSGINPLNGYTLLYSLNVSANDVRVSGISVSVGPYSSYMPFKISGGKPLQVFENCVGGDSSFFGPGLTVSGTFIGCVGGNFSFGSTASGTFINCKGGTNFGFGGSGGGIASGVFIDCSANWYAFGGSGSTASGTFTRCTGGNASFAGFGGATASGVFTNCRLTTGTFKSLTAPASGKALMINCIDGNGDIIEGQAPL